jgi:hypothetical protein
MELCVERIIAKPFPLVERTLMSGPSNWLPGTRAEDGSTTELDVRMAGSRIARAVAVRAGQVSCWPAEGRCRVPIAWHATRHREHYPDLVGTLELARVAPRRTKLTLRARYDPPVGWIGLAADEVVMHRIAEASVEAFVGRIAGILERGAMSRGLISAGPFPHGGE